MIRNSRRLVALTVAGAVAIAPVISGCGAGREPESARPTQLTEGVNVSVPKDATPAQVDIRNMFVLGPAAGVKVPASGAVPLYATLINHVRGRPDKLVGVSSPAFGQARLAGGGIALPAASPAGVSQAVSLATPAGQQPVVALQGLTQELLGGETVPLTLQFEQAGSVAVNVPVVSQQGDYASYAPVPSESPSSSASGKPAKGKSGSPNPASSVSPSGSTSANPAATPSG